MTGYACTSPLVDGNGNGYPTPYVANVTNAFGGSPSITYNWLPRPGRGHDDAAGVGISINSSGAVGDGGRGSGRDAKLRSTTAGRRSLCQFLGFSLPVPTGSGIAGDAVLDTGR